jgi:hypothetical protein
MPIIRGKVNVSSDNFHAQGIVAGTSNVLLGSHGTTQPAMPRGTGDYLSHLIVMQQVFTTVGSCSVYIADNLQGTTQVFGTVVAGTTTAIPSATVIVPLGLTSRFGPWRVTTQPGVSVTAVGKFTGLQT